MTEHDLLKKGGPWLAAARNWLQHNTINGDSVTWGSNDIIKPALTVKQIEELAAVVALSARLDAAKAGAKWAAEQLGEGGAWTTYAAKNRILSAIDEKPLTLEDLK